MLNAPTANATMLDIKAVLDEAERHCLMRVTTGKLSVVVEVVFMVQYEAPFNEASVGLATQALLMLVVFPDPTLITLSVQHDVVELHELSSPSMQEAGSTLVVLAARATH